MKKPMKLLNNKYRILHANSEEFFIELLFGRFAGRQVRIYDIAFDVMDFEDEKEVPVVRFDYEIFTKREYGEKTTKMLENLFIDILNEIIDNSIDYFEKGIDYDRVPD